MCIRDSFEAVAIYYVGRYARKVHADPTKSLLYGTKLDLQINASRDEQMCIRDRSYVR